MMMLGSNIHIANTTMHGSGGVADMWTANNTEMMVQDDYHFAAYKFEDEALEVDSKGSNTLTNSGTDVDYSSTGPRGNSALFDGTEQALIQSPLSDLSDWMRGEDDWLISFYAISDSLADTFTLFTMDTSAGTRPLAITNSATGKVGILQNDVATYDLESTASLSIIAFQHVVVAKLGTRYDIYLDGVPDSNVTIVDPMAVLDAIAFGPLWTDESIWQNEGRIAEANFWKNPVFADITEQNSFVSNLNGSYYAG